LILCSFIGYIFSNIFLVIQKGFLLLVGKTHPLYELRAKQIGGFIKQHWVTNYGSPSIREIRDGVGIKSESSVKRWIDLMVDQGDLIAEENKARSFRIPGMKITFD
jgi:SOS-response transcriptional repressor LexA